MSASVASQRSRSPSLVLVSYTRTAPAPFDRDGDFILRTAQETRYHVSLAILSFASSYFRDMAKVERNQNDEAILNVPESDAAIETLLRLTYPLPDPILRDLDDITEAYLAAKKYQFDVAAQTLRKMFARFAEEEPLRVYALARRFGMDEEANIAAYHACKTSSQTWPLCEEFDHISAAQYHELLQLHRRRGLAASQMVLGKNLCSLCPLCGKKWSKKWKKMAVEILTDAPTSDRMFSTAFIGKLAKELDCGECSHDMLQALCPMGALTRLKACMSDLPSSVVSMDSS